MTSARTIEKTGRVMKKWAIVVAYLVTVEAISTFFPGTAFCRSLRDDALAGLQSGRNDVRVAGDWSERNRTLETVPSFCTMSAFVDPWI